jgi:transcriptional regulator with XRE-family HTH domain
MRTKARIPWKTRGQGRKSKFQAQILGVGGSVEARRHLLGWTQAVLADRAGTTQGYISSVESGIVRNPSVWMLFRIAEALKITLAEIF